MTAKLSILDLQSSILDYLCSVLSTFTRYYPEASAVKCPNYYLR